MGSGLVGESVQKKQKTEALGAHAEQQWRETEGGAGSESAEESVQQRLDSRRAACPGGGGQTQSTLSGGT